MAINMTVGDAINVPIRLQKPSGAPAPYPAADVFSITQNRYPDATVASIVTMDDPLAPGTAIPGLHLVAVSACEGAVVVGDTAGDVQAPTDVVVVPAPPNVIVLDVAYAVPA